MHSIAQSSENFQPCRENSRKIQEHFINVSEIVGIWESKVAARPCPPALRNRLRRQTSPFLYITHEGSVLSQNILNARSLPSSASGKRNEPSGAQWRNDTTPPEHALPAGASPPPKCSRIIQKRPIDFFGTLRYSVLSTQGYGVLKRKEELHGTDTAEKEGSAVCG